MKKYLIIPLLAIAATVLSQSIQTPKSIATDPNGGQVRLSATNNGDGTYSLNTIGTGTDLIKLQKSIATDQNGGQVRLSGVKNNDGTFTLAIAGALPPMTGHDGQFLSTTGIIAHWTPSAGGGDAFVANPLSQFAATTSSQLRGVLTDENGTGAALFDGATNPSFTTGFKIGGAAPSGHYPRGNGTSYVDSAIQAGDVPTLNQNTTGYSSALKSATTTVDVSAATAPTTGQVLKATDSTHATWQAESGGGGFDPTANITFTGTDTFTGTVDMSAATVTLGTVSNLPVTTIDLGNADTTLARSSAGVITVEGVIVTRTIASGTSALGTSLITSGSCATAVSTSATGTLTTDTITWTPNADISGVTGYAPVTTGALIIYPYPTSDHVNWKVCNPTSSSITPGAVTLNWKVVR